MDLCLYSDASATDITDKFSSACKELGDLEFSMDPSFRLSDAMSAIEIMDPKMDSGMEYIERKLDHFKENIEAELSQLELSDIIAIFDASYSMLASWLNAQPPDQTLNTNLCFLVPPDTLKSSPYIHTIACTFLHIIQLLKLYISIANVQNEEDICLVINSVQNNFNEAQISELLKDAISRLDQTAKTKNNSQEIDAMRWRFEFLSELLELFRALLPSATEMTSASNDLPRFVPDFKTSNASTLQCIQLNKKILNTIHVGTQPPDGIDSNYSWLAVFDCHAHLYTSVPGFPRKPVIMSRTDSCKYFGLLLDKIVNIITKVPELYNSIGAILILLKQLAEDETSCILIRSVAQLIIMPNDHFIFGTTPLSDIIFNSLNRSNWTNNTNEDISPIERLMKENTRFNEFIHLTVRAFVNIFQTLGHNLAKQKEKFLRTNFEDLGALILEVNDLSDIDSRLAQLQLDNKNDPNNHFPSLQHKLSNFLLNTTLDLMYYHFSMGFRLRLLRPYEFHYTYWYFGDCVVRNLCSMSERACNALILEFSKSAIHSQKKISGKKQQQKTKMDNDFRRALAHIKMKSQCYRIEAVMSQAMCKLCLALILSQRMAIPEHEHLRYAKRVEHFTPLPMSLFYSYEEYLHESRILELQGVTDEECFANAAELFGKVVMLVKNTELKEDDPVSASLLALQKVAKQNMVVAKLLSTKKLEKRLSFEFTSDEQFNFPIIKLL